MAGWKAPKVTAPSGTHGSARHKMASTSRLIKSFLQMPAAGAHRAGRSGLPGRAFRVRRPLGFSLSFTFLVMLLVCVGEVFLAPRDAPGAAGSHLHTGTIADDPAIQVGPHIHNAALPPPRWRRLRLHCRGPGGRPRPAMKRLPARTVVPAMCSTAVLPRCGTAGGPRRRRRRCRTPSRSTPRRRAASRGSAISRVLTSRTGGSANTRSG